MNLPEFSVRHSILGHMVTLFVLVTGLIMVITMQRETFPEIEVDLVSISTAYPGASAEEIEDLITNPIEDELRDVEDVEEINSTSVEGVSGIMVEVNPDARHKERVFNEIQRSNMSKLGENGEPIYREDGKVLKGPNYFKPNITKILNS